MTVDVAPSDIDSLLDLGGTIDDDRADLLIRMAVTECLGYVSPLPDAAFNIVVKAAARAYLNPSGVQAETVGPNTVQYGSSMIGVYLTDSEKADLKRLSGRRGAFSIDTLPTGTSAVQLITVFAAGGTFTVTFASQTTPPIAWNASSATVLNALQALSLIQPGNISVTGEGPYTVTFVNDLATTPVPAMTANGASLTGTLPTVTVTVVTKGIFAPGQNLPGWDKDYFWSRRAQFPGSQF